MTPDSQKVVIAREIKSEYDLGKERKDFESSLFQTPKGAWLHICTIITTSRSGIEMIYENCGNQQYLIITDPELVAAIERAMPMPERRGGEDDDD